jgi:hypothetical protein
MIQWQREDWKGDSGWTEKNGDWKSKEVSYVNKPVDTYLHAYIHIHYG